jgi:hypothetical protein
MKDSERPVPIGICGEGLRRVLFCRVKPLKVFQGWFLKSVSPLLFCLIFFPMVAHGSPKKEAALLLHQAKPVVIYFSDDTTRWQGQTVFVGKLDNGAVIVKAHYMTLTTDGAAEEIRACDRTAQAGTALRDLHGKPTDANTIPYLVLPWCGGAIDRQQCKNNPPYRQLGLQMGDLAAVIAGEKIAFAIAADLGPEKRFGEGSVELHRRLGHETIGKDGSDPKCAKNESLKAEIFFIIFPGSNDRWLPADTLEKKGRALWNRLLQ